MCGVTCLVVDVTELVSGLLVGVILVEDREV